MEYVTVPRGNLPWADRNILAGRSRCVAVSAVSVDNCRCARLYQRIPMQSDYAFVNLLQCDSKT
jgi:hypothetical protein